MKILIAPDKFRGSLEATDVCRAVDAGIKLAFPQAETISVPLADGGEGTARILTEYTAGEFVGVQVQDPLGRNITAQYGISGDRKTAFIEMAAASGLSLIDRHEYNPLKTSTFGTGQLIAHAIRQGVENIILGIGGSATTDGGIGMAAALGYRFLDAKGEELPGIGESLDKICSIDSSDAAHGISSVNIVVACDVTNPLFGESGAAYVYGPQKGADSDMVVRLDDGLRNLSAVAVRTFGKDYSVVPGAGAAGGVGAGALWFLSATLKEGVGIVMEQTGIEQHIREADLVITGEGKVDAQTLQGKVIKGLADMCIANQTPLTVVCGTLDITPEQSKAAGITCAVSVLTKPITLEGAFAEAYANIRDATFNLVRLFFSGTEIPD